MGDVNKMKKELQWRKVWYFLLSVISAAIVDDDGEQRWKGVMVKGSGGNGEWVAMMGVSGDNGEWWRRVTATESNGNGEWRWWGWCDWQWVWVRSRWGDAGMPTWEGMKNHVYILPYISYRGERERKVLCPQEGQIFAQVGNKEGSPKSEVVSIYGCILKLEAGHGKVRWTTLGILTKPFTAGPTC